MVSNPHLILLGIPFDRLLPIVALQQLRHSGLIKQPGALGLGDGRVRQYLGVQSGDHMLYKVKAVCVQLRHQPIQ